MGFKTNWWPAVDEVDPGKVFSASWIVPSTDLIEGQIIDLRECGECQRSLGGGNF